MTAAADREKAALLAQMAHELAAREGAPMEIVLRPTSAIALAGLIQLASRHPQNTGDVAAIGRRFVEGVRDYFADCPAVLEVMRLGDDPAEDR